MAKTLLVGASVATAAAVVAAALLGPVAFRGAAVDVAAGAPAFATAYSFGTRKRILPGAPGWTSTGTPYEHHHHSLQSSLQTSK